MKLTMRVLGILLCVILFGGCGKNVEIADKSATKKSENGSNTEGMDTGKAATERIDYNSCENNLLAVSTSKHKHKKTASAEYYEELGYSDAGRIFEDLYDLRWNYACWRNMVILGEDVYKKENGVYIQSQQKIYDLFDMEKTEWEQNCLAGVKQYENWMIALDKSNNEILVCDLDSFHIIRYESYEHNNLCGYTWWVLNGMVYYMVEDAEFADRILVRMDVNSGVSEKIISLSDHELNEGKVLTYSFMIRKDASIVISIYNKNTYATEYWRGYQKAEGEWEWRFLTELNDYLYNYELGYNTNGIYIMGEFPTVINGSKSETVCIDDSGTITTPELPLYRQILAEDGYYLCEYEEQIDAVTYEMKVTYDFLPDQINCLTHYDYEGNLIRRYLFETPSGEGYKLNTIIYHEDRILLFFTNEDKGSMKIYELTEENHA